MELFDTYTKSLVDLPLPRGPVRMYICGPTVYARAHVGNARPFVVGMWWRSWLKVTGYDVTFVHNITDVNDKIYDAAPGASAALAKEATAWYLEDTEALGLGMPDELPKVSQNVPVIVEFIEELIEAGHAYEVEGDVYFRVSSFPDYGKLSGQDPDQVEEQEPNALKEDPRDFALWKKRKEGEDTSWVSPWGKGRPGWHIECSAMAEKAFGEAFEIHGGGLDLVFPHHENELAQSRALGHEFASIWAHNGLVRFTGDKMSKSEGSLVTLREAIDQWGREALLMFFLSGHWRKPIDFSEETMAQAQARVETFRNAFTQTGGKKKLQLWDDFTDALEDDFDTPAALAVMHDWATNGQHDLLREALEIFGLKSLAAVDEAPPEIVALADKRMAAREADDYEEADRLRTELDAAGWRDARPAGRQLPPSPQALTPDLVYGRRAVREALRGRREVLEVWATERALQAEPWLGDGSGGASAKVRQERELTELAGTRDHQGVVARVEPYRYADAYELAAVERPLLAVLDRVTDPRNLGAVCRSAEGAGATGVVVPAHGAAVVTPAVVRSSAGAVEHLPIAVVTNLARYLEEVKGPELWVHGATGEGGTAMWDADLAGGVALVFGAEGKGLRPLVRRSCDVLVSIPLLGSVESLNVSVAAALLLYEARRQRRDG